MKNVLSKFMNADNAIPVVDKRKIWFILPVVVVVIAIIMFTIFAVSGGSFSSGINLGIDFTGGTILTVQLGTQAEGDNLEANKTIISNIVTAQGMKINYIQSSGTGTEASIVVKYQSGMTDAETEEANTVINDAIQVAYPDIYAVNQQFITYEYIGASTSTTLVTSALISTLVASVLILIYIIFRFEIFSGLSAIIALLHDVLIIMCVTTIFHIQINSTFIAVIITIIAYSINNTIVVFDRVRENMKAQPQNMKIDFDRIVNRSVTDTLGRSINTTITTMLTITMLAIFSGDTIRDFALLIMVGLLAGTFSSLLIAPSLYALFRDKHYEKKNTTKYVGNVKAVKKA